jgi:2,4-dienoyl-CoA reductase-like NADH-dependent reductase (Old Yellow Enzyme family)/thioredoxin reductase
MEKIRLLFEPIKIGSVELRNKVVMAPMATHLATEDGSISQRQIDYYTERAKGGVGLVITESCCVRDDGRRKKYRLSISEDKLIPGFKRLVRSVHNFGSKIAVQLHHGGRLCTPRDINEFPISASTYPCPLTGGDFFIGNIARVLKKEEIKELVQCFGEGARRAYEAEFDLIQIHAGHGYLINNFLSPESNKREDGYGGSLENRMRFLIEVIDCVRRKTKGKLPIMVRFDGSEFIPGGYGLEEAEIIAKKLEENGVNEVNITAGNHGSVEWTIQPAEFAEGSLVYLAEQIKRHVNILVSTVGKINDPFFAEKLLKEKKADLIYFGRALLADPELPVKSKEGRIGEIRKCICCMNCVSRISQGIDINCSVNAQAGREKEFAISPSAHTKKVAIIGGGPAGMEAARVLSLRGHKVTIFEKNNEMGGLINIAFIPPYRIGLKSIVDYLNYQLKILKVDVRLNNEFKVNKRRLWEFDVVLFATGSIPMIPRINGINVSNIMTSDECFLSKKVSGKRYVIIGGGVVGLQCADFLIEKKRDIDVVVIEKESSIARDIGNIEKKMILNRLLNKGVRILINSQISKIEDGQVIIKVDGEKKNFKFDKLIISIGRLPNNPYQHIAGRLKKCYVVGDCLKPRKIIDAIHDACKLALRI